MTGVAGTTRAYLELARVSNLPTCVTNTLVGTALGAMLGGVTGGGTKDGIVGGAFPWRVAAVVTVGIALLYVAGMALNDVVDADVDRRQRPGRPIPSGRVSRRGAFVFTVVAMGLGVATVALCGARALGWSLGLAACIVLYDVLHRRTPAAAVLMGACRGLVYFVAAAAVAPVTGGLVLGVTAAAITTYVVVLTLLARREHAERAPVPGPGGVEHTLPLVAAAPALVVRPETLAWAALAGVAMTLWLVRCGQLVRRRPPRVKTAVLGWLAGICLVDTFYLTLLDRPEAALVAVICFIVTVGGHRFVSGT